MRWRRHETIEKSRRLLGFALDGQGVHAREWSGFRGKADIGVVSNALRCVEAANALIRVHKASTQNQNLRSKTSKISMSQRKNCKSCHSDQLSSQEKSSRGTSRQQRSHSRRATSLGSGEICGRYLYVLPSARAFARQRRGEQIDILTYQSPESELITEFGQL
jgi:hypothetical protein